MKLLLYLWLMLTGELSADAIVIEADAVPTNGPVLDVRPDQSGTQISGDSREVLNQRLIILEDTHFRRY